MRSDFSPDPKDLQIPEPTPTLYYVLGRCETTGVEGIFVILERSPILCEVHFCFPECWWGKPARSVCAAFLPWLWADTKYVRAIGNIPAHNWTAIRMAKRFGFTEFGRNPKCFLKDGILRDEIWLGVSRPETQ